MEAMIEKPAAKAETCEKCGSASVNATIVGAALIDEKVVMECEVCGHREGMESYLKRMSVTLNI